MQLSPGAAGLEWNENEELPATLGSTSILDVRQRKDRGFSANYVVGGEWE
jgi:hypothetical protein